MELAGGGCKRGRTDEFWDHSQRLWGKGNWLRCRNKGKSCWLRDGERGGNMERSRLDKGGWVKRSVVDKRSRLREVDRGGNSYRSRKQDRSSRDLVVAIDGLGLPLLPV